MLTTTLDKTELRENQKEKIRIQMSKRVSNNLLLRTMLIHWYYRCKKLGRRMLIRYGPSY